MSYQSKYKAFVNPDFRGRVMMAARKVAADIYYEDAKTEYHQTRLRFAERVRRAMTESDPVVLDFVLVILDNATIGANIADDGTYPGPDGDLEYVITSAWNERAELA